MSHSGVARNWLSSFSSRGLSFWYRVGVLLTSTSCTSISVKGMHAMHGESTHKGVHMTAI